MRNYIRKKFPNCQILSVESSTKHDGIQQMRPLREPYLIAGVPSGCFVIEENALLLPKKRHGEKFIVHYTVVLKAIL